MTNNFVQSIIPPVQVLNDTSQLAAALSPLRMAETLAAWDARLERTPVDTPAHLLTMVPDAPRATRRGVAPKQRMP